MTTRTLRSLLFALMAAPALLSADDRFTGQWHGTIQMPDEVLRIDLMLEKSAQEWQGSLDIPGQSVVGLPLVDIDVEDDALAFKLAGVPGDPSMRGTLVDGGIVGEFRQGDGVVPFELSRERPDEAPMLTADQAAAIIDAQLEAYNRHDLDSFVALFHDDITQVRYPDRLQGSSKDELRASFEQTFKSKPHERVLERIVHGNHVIDKISVRFTIGGRTMEHVGTVIYTLKDGLIHRMSFID